MTRVFERGALYPLCCSLQNNNRHSERSPRSEESLFSVLTASSPAPRTETLPTSHSIATPYPARSPSSTLPLPRATAASRSAPYDPQVPTPSPPPEPYSISILEYPPYRTCPKLHDNSAYNSPLLDSPPASALPPARSPDDPCPFAHPASGDPRPTH